MMCVFLYYNNYFSSEKRCSVIKFIFTFYIKITFNAREALQLM